MLMRLAELRITGYQEYRDSTYLEYTENFHERMQF